MEQEVKIDVKVKKRNGTIPAVVALAIVIAITHLANWILGTEVHCSEVVAYMALLLVVRLSWELPQ